MKIVNTLDPRELYSCLQTSGDHSDSIIMADAEGIDLDAMVSCLQAQTKHGSLGESLAWLYIDDDEKGVECLYMKEDRKNADWLKAYAAVYWFVTGWSDCEFSNAKG
jgi:hypothetical protein